MKKLVARLKLGAVKDIVVIGDVMLDEYIIGHADRISPEVPVPVVKEQRREWRLGGAANVAANCRHIGFRVNMVGIIGEDGAGQRLCGLLRELNIQTDGLIRSQTRVTTSKKRIVAQNHQLLRIDNEEISSLQTKEYNELLLHVDRLIKPGVIVYISDYAKGVVSSELLSYVIIQAKKYDCLVMVDPKGPDFFKYKGAHYIKPNAKEFKQIIIVLEIDHTLSMVEQARMVCQKLELKGLFITLGDKGIQYVSPQEQIYSPACAQDVFDLTGAGDTVGAFLALSMAHGLDIYDCLSIANRAAAVAVSHVKTYAVSIDELIDRESEPTEKIYMDWMALKIDLDWARRDGKKVVFTNGCFDILHSGHVYILKEAKKLGDLLVVAINTDDSVRRFKGSSRPINTLQDRMDVMASLGVVDFVVFFDQNTPQELIEYLRPDVLVKGGDYTIDAIAGSQFVQSYGGSVRVIDLVPEKSTTRVIAKMRELV